LKESEKNTIDKVESITEKPEQVTITLQTDTPLYTPKNVKRDAQMADKEV
jgi:hypothetical protein